MWAGPVGRMKDRWTVEIGDWRPIERAGEDHEKYGGMTDLFWGLVAGRRAQNRAEWKLNPGAYLTHGLLQAPYDDDEPAREDC